MTSVLEEARMVRARKNKVAEHIVCAAAEIGEIFWIHPNGQPVYLDYDQVASLRYIQRQIAEILERHKEAEKAL